MTRGVSERPGSAVFYSAIRGEPWGAPDYVWPVAARALCKRGIPVMAVVHPEAISRDEIASLRELGVRVHPLPSGGGPRGRVDALRRAFAGIDRKANALRRDLAALPNPRVFVNQGGWRDALHEDCFREWARSGAGQYDVFCHLAQYAGPLSESERAGALAMLLGAKRVLFNSRWTRRVVELALLASLPNAAYFPCRLRFRGGEPLPWPETGRIRIAAVCRLDVHHKGLDLLVEAASLLPANLPDWRIDIFGRGKDAAYLQGLARFLGVDARVGVHDFIEDVRDIWASSHVLALTSRYEGLGVSMLEAMACGRPVVRTPYGGCEEWIEDGVTGFVCEAAEPRLIAQALERAIRSGPGLKEMGLRAARRIAEAHPEDPERVYLEAFA